MKNVIKLTVNQAVAMFLNYRKEVSASGVAFSNLSYNVAERGSKTVKGQNILRKDVTVNATLGSDYGKKVGRILDKEGKVINFVPQPRKGLKRLGDSPICTDVKTSSKFYLDFIVEGHSKPNVQLLLNGEKVERKDVWNADYITTANLKPKEKIAGRGLINAEHNFHFRSVEFTNLKSFNMNGNTYQIVD